jgi:hypothetical protein
MRALRKIGGPRWAALVRTNGNTTAVLGLSSAQFEAAWYAWVSERYLS